MIDMPGRSGQIRTEDHITHYLEWGDAANPRVLLLLHGFLGHAHWWDFVAPWFKDQYRVIAIDFGGMGDSSWRARYTNASFLGEVGAALKFIGRPDVTVIGHSFGGRVTIFSAEKFPEYIARAIVVDSKIGFSDRPVRPKFAPRPKKVYPDLETVCTRFRFLPEEPPVLPAIMRHLAMNSAKSAPGGFVWKFDESLMGGVDWETETEGEVLARLDLPVDYIAGELSEVVPLELAQRIGATLRRGQGPIIIPSAHHHVPVNQPLALVSALRAVLSSKRP